MAPAAPGPPPAAAGDAEVAEAEAEISGEAVPELVGPGAAGLPPAAVPELDDSKIPPVPEEIEQIVDAPMATSDGQAGPAAEAPGS